MSDHRFYRVNVRPIPGSDAYAKWKNHSEHNRKVFEEARQFAQEAFGTSNILTVQTLDGNEEITGLAWEREQEVPEGWKKGTDRKNPTWHKFRYPSSNKKGKEARAFVHSFRSRLQKASDLAKSEGLTENPFLSVDLVWARMSLLQLREGPDTKAFVISLPFENEHEFVAPPGYEEISDRQLNLLIKTHNLTVRGDEAAAMDREESACDG